MKHPRAEARFDLKQEEDHRAWEFLRSSQLSRSRLIIAALNAYAEAQNEQTRQDAFCERVIETIRTELHGNPMNVSTASSQPEEQTSNTDENAIDAFLDSFM